MASRLGQVAATAIRAARAAAPIQRAAVAAAGEAGDDGGGEGQEGAGEELVGAGVGAVVGPVGVGCLSAVHAHAREATAPAATVARRTCHWRVPNRRATTNRPPSSRGHSR